MHAAVLGALAARSRLEGRSPLLRSVSGRPGGRQRPQTDPASAGRRRHSLDEEGDRAGRSGPRQAAFAVPGEPWAGGRADGRLGARLLHGQAGIGAFPGSIGAPARAQGAGGLAGARRPPGPPARRGAFQWKRVFDAAVSGRLTPRQLQAFALDYPTREPKGARDVELAFDPVPTQLELRYDVPPEPPPIEILAETAVRSGRGAERRAGRHAPEEAHSRTRRAGARAGSASRPRGDDRREGCARAAGIHAADSAVSAEAAVGRAVRRGRACRRADRGASPHWRTNVYLRGSLASGEPLYGLSDIDLVAVAADESESRRVRRRFEALCRALPPLRGLMPHFCDLRRAEPCDRPRRRVPGQRAR